MSHSGAAIENRPRFCLSAAGREIVVVGGGIIGAATAYALTHHPKWSTSDRLTIVEAVELASGASGKAGGLLSRDWHHGPTASLGRASFALHAKLAEEHGGDAWGYRRLDVLSVSLSTNLKAKRREKIPVAVSWLGPAVTKTSVLGSKADMAQVHPRLLTRKLVDLASQKGAKVVIATAIGLERDADDRPTAVKVESSDGTLSALPCSKVIIAAGPWSERVVNKLLSGCGKGIAIEGSRAHSIVLKAEALSEHALFTHVEDGRSDGEPELYCRPDGTGYLCGPTDDEPLPDPGQTRIDPAAIDQLKRWASIISPDQLGQKAVVQHEQSCYLPISTRTGLPIIGQLAPGVWVGTGHSCWGISNSLATGSVLAELILDGKATTADVSSLAPQ